MCWVTFHHCSGHCSYGWKTLLKNQKLSWMWSIQICRRMLWTNITYLGSSVAMASCPWVCWVSFASLAYLCENKGTPTQPIVISPWMNYPHYTAVERYRLRCIKKKTAWEYIFDEQVQDVYLSIFSISVPTSHCSCRKSMGDEDRSSRMGASELSSILKSTLGSESVPSGPDGDTSRERNTETFTTYTSKKHIAMITWHKTG